MFIEHYKNEIFQTMNHSPFPSTYLTDKITTTSAGTGNEIVPEIAQPNDVEVKKSDNDAKCTEKKTPVPKEFGNSVNQPSENEFFIQKPSTEYPENSSTPNNAGKKNFRYFLKTRHLCENLNIHRNRRHCMH